MPGAGLAGTARAVRLPLRSATAGPGSPDRAGSLTGALPPRPARWLCLQQHDTASDKISPCRGHESASRPEHRRQCDLCRRRPAKERHQNRLFRAARLRRARHRPATHSRQGGAARWPASGRDETAAKSAGSMRVVMSAIRPRRPHRRWPWPRLRVACNRPGTSGAYPVKSLFPRGPALPSGRVPAICSASGPRSGPAPPRAGTDLAVTLHLTCSAIVRPRGERDDRAGCLPRRAAGTGARRYSKSRREGGRRMAHAARPHRPAARSAAACHRPP